MSLAQPEALDPLSSSDESSSSDDSSSDSSLLVVTGRGRVRAVTRRLTAIRGVLVVVVSASTAGCSSVFSVTDASGVSVLSSLLVVDFLILPVFPLRLQRRSKIIIKIHHSISILS